VPSGSGMALSHRRGKSRRGSDPDFGLGSGELVYDPASGHVL